MWCKRLTSSFVDSSPEVRGQGREVRGWGSRDKVFELDLSTWKSCLVGLALTPTLSAAAAARLDGLSLGLGIFTFAFRLLLFAFVSLLGFSSDSSINVDVALQHESWVAAWVVGASLTANRRFRSVWFPKREVSEGRVRGIEIEKKRRRKKGGLKGEKIDARERSTVCIGSCLIFRCATWFLSFFDNSNEMVKQSLCSCDLKKWEMSDVRCQERARREKRGERGGFIHDWPVGYNFDHPNH